MAINKFAPHLLILPEDDANRQIANGFCLDAALKTNRLQVLDEAGGWLHVIKSFLDDQVAGMERYSSRHVLLVLDFDKDAKRLETVKSQIPKNVAGRVYVIGAWGEPEDLRPKIGSYESIGREIAKDCREATDAVWNHALLCHNAAELKRLRENVHPFLFE